MKKNLSMALLLLLIMAMLTACGSKQAALNGASTPEDGQKGEEAAELKVGLLLPGSINDNGWNALGYGALMEIKDTYGATVNYIENVDTSSMQEQFELLASQNYQIIFGHGAQFADAAKTVAERYPGTYFVLTSTDAFQEPNVLSTNISNYNAGFIMGCVAAKTSQSGVIGYVSGEYYDSFVNFGDGYAAGAAYVNPDTLVLTAFTEDSSDAALAKEAAVAQIDQGADVITANCNQAALGSIEACQERGITALGYPSDYNEVSDCILMSGCENQSMLFSNIVRLYEEGNLEGRFYEFGFADGAITLSWGDTDTALREEIETIIKDLESGKIG